MAAGRSADGPAGVAPMLKRSETSRAAGAPLRSPVKFRSTRTPHSGANPSIISWGQTTGDRFLFVLRQPLFSLPLKGRESDADGREGSGADAALPLTPTRSAPPTYLPLSGGGEEALCVPCGPPASASAERAGADGVDAIVAEHEGAEAVGAEEAGKGLRADVETAGVGAERRQNEAIAVAGEAAAADRAAAADDARGRVQVAGDLAVNRA